MEGDPTTALDIWSALAAHVKVGELYDLGDLYTHVERRVVRVAGDFEPDAPGSSQPRWRRNVRNVLQAKRKSGHIILWDRATYALAD